MAVVKFAFILLTTLFILILRAHSESLCASAGADNQFKCASCCAHMEPMCVMRQEVESSDSTPCEVLCKNGSPTAAEDAYCMQGQKVACCRGTSPYLYPCPAGTYSELVDEGIYGFNSECLDCPAGTYNPNTGSTSLSDCESCPVGTYNPNTGSTSLSDCESCSAGTYASTTGSSTCQPCAAGTSSAAGASCCTDSDDIATWNYVSYGTYFTSFADGIQGCSMIDSDVPWIPTTGAYITGATAGTAWGYCQDTATNGIWYTTDGIPCWPYAWSYVWDVSEGYCHAINTETSTCASTENTGSPCTEFTSAGQPWCATTVAFVSNSLFGTTWTYCTPDGVC